MVYNIHTLATKSTLPKVKTLIYVHVSRLFNLLYRTLEGDKKKHVYNQNNTNLPLERQIIKVTNEDLSSTHATKYNTLRGHASLTR